MESKELKERRRSRSRGSDRKKHKKRHSRSRSRSRDHHKKSKKHHKKRHHRSSSSSSPRPQNRGAESERWQQRDAHAAFDFSKNRDGTSKSDYQSKMDEKRQQKEEEWKKKREEDLKNRPKKPHELKIQPPPASQNRMMEVIVNDRLGQKVRVKCMPEDTIGELKMLISAHTGVRAEKIRLQKSHVIYKD